MTTTRDALRPWVPAFSEEFLDRATALFAEAEHVMIVGSLGSGRGDLATQLAGPAASTAWGRGGQDVPLERQAYAALNQLIPPLRAAADESVADVTSRASELIGSTFAPPIFVLHEVELCDRGTVDVVAELVAGGLIRLISTIGPAAATEHKLARRTARIDLPPLDEDTIGHLLAERFGAVPHPLTITMLAERSQGAYAILRRLADAAFETGELRILSGVLVIDSGSSTDHTADADLGEDSWLPRFGGQLGSRDLVDVAALADTLDADEAVTAFGLDAVSDAIHIGAIRRDGGLLTFASRVEAELLRRSLGAERRAALHQRYGDRLPRTFAIASAATSLAEWVLSAGATLTPGLAVRAVTLANRQGRYVLAHEFADAVPRGEWTSRLQVEVGHACAESGTKADLAEVIEQIDPTTLDDVDLFVFLRLAIRALDADRTAQLLASVTTAAEADDDTSRLEALSLLTLGVRAYEDGSPEIGRALNSLVFSGRLAPENHAMALVVHAIHLRHTSETGRALRLVQEAVQILESLPLVATVNIEVAREVQVLTLLSNADFAGAKVALTEYSTVAAPFGNVGRLGTALWGFVSFFAGDLATALAHTRLCLARMPTDDTHLLRPWVEAMTAQILVQIGAIEDAEELLALSAGRPAHPRRQSALECALTRACVHDALGEPEEALDILQPMVAEAREHGLRLQQVDAAVLCVQIGGPQHLPLLLEATRDVGDDCGTSTIWKRFAEAIDTNDMGSLVRLAVDLDTDDVHLFAAEIAQFTLDIARRASDMTPETRLRLQQIADPMAHRQVSRQPSSEGSGQRSDDRHQRHDD